MFRTRFYSALFLAALLAGGCSSRLVRHDVIGSTGKIALVSTVMPRVADTAHETNLKVLQAAVDHAAAKIQVGLADLRPWKVLDAAAAGEGKTAASIASASHMDLAGLFPEANEQQRIREAVGTAITEWRTRFIGAEGLPVIPREALVADDAQQDPTIRTVMLDQAGKLSSALQVDAVVFAQMRCSITHPRENAFIVTDERTDGLLSLAASLLIVDKNGRIIVDTGDRPLSGNTPSRDLLPLYRGEGKEAVTAGNIDLADRRKKIAQAFTALIDEAVANLMAGLKPELAK